MATIEIPDFYGFAAKHIDEVHGLISAAQEELGPEMSFEFPILRDPLQYDGTLTFLAATQELGEGDFFSQGVHNLLKGHGAPTIRSVRGQLMGLMATFSVLPETSVTRMRMEELTEKARAFLHGVIGY